MKKVKSFLSVDDLAYFAFFGLVSLSLVWKVFYIADCFAFDVNDDRNHTFVNLFSSWKIFSQGEIPLINFYNNFGTPLLGDALTFPFALQSLTYAFFPSYVALTINRVVIAWATLVTLYLFFRYFFRRFVSLLCSLVSFFTAGFFWHFAHHHYQLSLLIITSCLLLIMVDRKKHFSAFITTLLFTVVLVIFYLSVSIQIVLLAFPFLLFAAIFLGQKRTVYLLILGIIGASIMSFPLNKEFFTLIRQSDRILNLYNSQVNYSLFGALKSTIVYAGYWVPFRNHVDIALYFSLSFLLFSSFGVYFLFHPKKAPKSSSEEILLGYPKLAWTTLILGVLPLLTILFLIIIQSIWYKLPFLRSTDITRFWWISNIFLSLGLGHALEKILQGSYTKKQMFYLLLLTGEIILLLVANQPDIIKYPSMYEMLFLLTLLFSLFLLKWEKVPPKWKRHFFVKLFQEKGVPIGLAILFVLAIHPLPKNYVYKDSQKCFTKNHYFSLREHATFSPKKFLAHLEPSYRFATSMPSYLGHDLLGIFEGLLGSNGQSIVMKREFTNFLDRNKIIHKYGNPSKYYFSGPWQTEKLEQLGIRYVITEGADDSLLKEGWEILASVKGISIPLYKENNDLFLYQNPKRPTPFYLQSEKTGRNFIRDYQFSGNAAEIILPPLSETQELIATFVDRAGWKVTVDGNLSSFSVGEDQFLRIPVSPGNHVARISYEPLNWGNLFIFFLMGLFFPMAIIIFFKARKKAQKPAKKFFSL